MGPSFPMQRPAARAVVSPDDLLMSVRSDKYRFITKPDKMLFICGNPEPMALSSMCLGMRVAAIDSR
eukprot:COSAG04_NODE_30220_length_264_cov_0.624242_1_plen_66_part_01